jgi:hypothetical protein
MLWKFNACLGKDGWKCRRPAPRPLDEVVHFETISWRTIMHNNAHNNVFYSAGCFVVITRCTFGIPSVPFWTVCAQPTHARSTGTKRTLKEASCTKIPESTKRSLFSMMAGLGGVDGVG